jgi:hypothetical protein
VALGVDPDAQAFITAAALTNPTHQSAVDTLVKALKSNGTWSKYIAIYPLVGGTADSHKYNLKDPRDLDAAYRIGWVGTINHSADGFSNTTPSYGNTFYTGAVHSMGCYTPNNQSLVDAAMGGNVDNGTAPVYIRTQIHARYSDGVTYMDTINATSGRVSAATTGPIGYLTSSYSPGVACFGCRNGTQIASTTPPNGLPPSGLPFYVGGSSVVGGTGSNEGRVFSFFTIANYLTLAEIAADYTAIQAYQTALGRAV